jgi:hypothetical protein
MQATCEPVVAATDTHALMYLQWLSAAEEAPHAKGGRHTIALSLSEVRPEDQALVGRHDSRLMCRPLLPMCQRLPLEAGRCADGATSDRRLHRCCHCESRQRISPKQSFPDRVRFPSHYDRLLSFTQGVHWACLQGQWYETSRSANHRSCPAVCQYHVRHCRVPRHRSGTGYALHHAERTMQATCEPVVAATDTHALMCLQWLSAAEEEPHAK